MKMERIENMFGGNGHVILKRLIGETELNGKCGLFAEVESIVIMGLFVW